MAALNSIHAKVMKKVFSQWFELFIDVMLYLNPLITYVCAISGGPDMVVAPRRAVA